MPCQRLFRGQFAGDWHEGGAPLGDIVSNGWCSRQKGCSQNGTGHWLRDSDSLTHGAPHAQQWFQRKLARSLWRNRQMDWSPYRWTCRLLLIGRLRRRRGSSGKSGCQQSPWDGEPPNKENICWNRFKWLMKFHKPLQLCLTAQGTRHKPAQPWMKLMSLPWQKPHALSAYYEESASCGAGQMSLLHHVRWMSEGICCLNGPLFGKLGSKVFAVCN